MSNSKLHDETVEWNDDMHRIFSNQIKGILRRVSSEELGVALMKVIEDKDMITKEQHELMTEVVTKIKRNREESNV